MPGKKTRRARRTQIEERSAPKAAADKIRKLAEAKIAAEDELTKTIEDVALGMGLDREKGKTQWSYEVASGKFLRRSGPSQASPST